MVDETTFKETEIGRIPLEWRVATIREIGDVKMCRRIFSHQTTMIGEIPFFKIGTFGKEPDAFIPKLLYHQYRLKYSFPKKGDILISAAGTIGRTSVYNGEDAYFQDSNIVWVDNKSQIVSNEYLNYVYQIIKYKTEGGTIQRLYNNILLNAAFPLPPLEEQKAIAEVLSDVDELIAQTERLIAKKEAIKMGVMQELLRPKEGWVQRQLDEIAELQSGGTPQTLVKEYYDGDIPWVVIADITKAGKYISETEKTISKLALENSSAKLFKKGVLLFAMYASIGKTTIAQMDTACNQAILGIQVKGISSDYLYYFLTHHQKSYSKIGQTGTQSNLSKELVSKFVIDFPSDVQEQTAIVELLSLIDREIEFLREKQRKMLAIKSGMQDQLLTGKTRLV